MAVSPSEPLLLGHVRKLFASGTAAARSDRDLVDRFAQARDEQAFEALVRRHGPMVFRVCQRVLGRDHEAEDAFQATFLVFARKAGSLRDQASVGSWLYGVASRVALKARASARQDIGLAQRSVVKASATPLEELTLGEVRAALDEEMARLPDKFRGPLVLCCLEGRARDEAAQELGLPFSTLKSRLEQGRELLRQRLVRRGLTLPSMLSAALLTGEASAAVPEALLRATARYAVLFEAGLLGAEADAPAGALALAKGALNVMPTGKLVALSASALLAVVLTAAGTMMHLFAGEPASPAVASPGQAERLPALARKMWAVTELVAKHHPAPPPRANMFAEGARALCKEANTAVPGDLQRLAGDVSSPDQLATFLKSVWPGAGSPGKTPEQLEAAAMKGLLRSIPGEPNLLSSKEVRVNSQVSANRYVGIGIQIAMDEKARRAVIVDPFRRGTAYKAGVKPKDLIVRVDGKDTLGAPLAKVVDWLRGEEGTTVEVEVRQPDQDTGRTYTITRAPVPFDTVFGHRYANEGWHYRIGPKHPVGYVYINSITSSTLHELRQAERRLRAEGGRAVVLDLRNCSGGELHTGGLVAGSLIDRKVLWRIRDAHGGVKETRSGDEVLFRDWPMAVLVNAKMPGTVAEVMSAALQDTGRATIVGERTSTDGYVNTLLPLSEGGPSLVLRTGRLERTAKGRGWPVEPDHPVTLDKAGATAVAAWLMAKGRSDLTPGADKPPADPQLARAVEVLETAAGKSGQEK